MKKEITYENLQIIKSVQTSCINTILMGTVDEITTYSFFGFVLKRFVVTRKVFRDYSIWYFGDTGEYTPSNEIERLFYVYQFDNNFKDRIGKYST